MDNYDHPGPSTEEVINSGCERFRVPSKRSGKQSLRTEPDRTREQTWADQTRIKQLQDSLSGEASHKPEWAERKVSLSDLSDINLRKIPIGWKSLTDLGRAINKLKEDPFEARDLADIKPPRETYPALPMVASVIANKRNPDIPVVLPTQAEVKAMKPWLTTVENFIERFSQNWARKFGGYVERRGQQIVVDIGTRIIAITEQMRAIENPKHQFVTELTNLYNHLAKPEYEEVYNFFEGENHQELIKIEDKIHKLLSSLRYVRDGGNHRLYSRDQYPLLAAILPIIKFPPDTLDDDQASLAGAELMEGIHTFLKQQDVTSLVPAPRAQEIDLFNPESWMRGIAETFFREKLERVKKGLPHVLTQAYGVLPPSGPQMSDMIYDVAETICVLTAQGTPNEIIASHVFVR